MGLVPSLGFGFELVGDVFVLGALSDGPDRAIDEAVGAASEVLDAFLATGELVKEGALAEIGVLGWLAGDFSEIVAALVEAFVVDIAAGLLDDAVVFGTGLSADFLLAADLPFGLRYSATGGNATPPLTAASLEGSAGFMSLDSSSAPVTGLSGLSGGSSS